MYVLTDVWFRGFINCKILFVSNAHLCFEVWKLAQTSLAKPHGRGSEPYDVRGKSAGLLGASRNEAMREVTRGNLLSLTQIDPASRLWRTDAIDGCGWSGYSSHCDPAGLDLMAWGVVQMTSKFAVRANES